MLRPHGSLCCFVPFHLGQLELLTQQLDVELTRSAWLLVVLGLIKVQLHVDRPEQASGERAGTKPILCGLFTLWISPLRLVSYLIFSSLLVSLHMEAIFIVLVSFWLQRVRLIGS